MAKVSDRVADALSMHKSLQVMLRVNVPDFNSFHDLFTTNTYYFGDSTRCLGCETDRFLTIWLFLISGKVTLCSRMQLEGTNHIGVVWQRPHGKELDAPINLVFLLLAGHA